MLIALILASTFWLILTFHHCPVLPVYQWHTGVWNLIFSEVDKIESKRGGWNYWSNKLGFLLDYNFDSYLHFLGNDCKIKDSHNYRFTSEDHRLINAPNACTFSVLICSLSSGIEGTNERCLSNNRSNHYSVLSWRSFRKYLSNRDKWTQRKMTYSLYRSSIEEQENNSSRWPCLKVK